MYKRVIKLLDTKLQHNKKFGFQSNHFTTHAILLAVNQIQRAVKRNALFSCGLFLDLSKAFVSVNHEILISKLQYYGIHGISNNWFISHLKGR